MANEDADRRWSPYDSPAGWVRGLAIAAAVGLFLAFSGAFGTGEAPAARRYPYWVGLLLIGALWGPFVSRLFFRPGEPRKGVWLRVIAVALVLAATLTGVVALATAVVLGERMPLARLPWLFSAVAAISGAMTALNVLISGPRAQDAAPAPAPPKFLERLPLKLRGAEVWAVEAEDHYLRLHTSKGQDLILLRLSDAVDELQGLEGAQVHRSWWVARDAIVDARRNDGRATLTLKDGSEVPVSRTYARELREKGWI
ncbi:LytTR family DNA-binding domain-containing protein [Phenylobacterium terrae]|uniref:LytTR family DNA-binding domain-containing protein n=1 Tax=Phenylobacterium terrae TaxID=2665495 RepID=A0ABW4N4K2_9CAUL